MKWQLYAGAAIAALLALSGAYQAGKWAKGAEIRAQAAEARIEALKKAGETANEIDDLSDDERGSAFDGLW